MLETVYSKPGLIILYLQRTIQISTPTPPVADLYDITSQVENIISESGVKTGLVNVYAQGAAAGVMICYI
jgi:thiamine phosphate synthase YjbQ (UPF0047 family)